MLKVFSFLFIKQNKETYFYNIAIVIEQDKKRFYPWKLLKGALKDIISSSRLRHNVSAQSLNL